MPYAVQRIAPEVREVDAYLDFPKLQKQFLKDLDIKKSSVSTYKRSLGF